VKSIIINLSMIVVLGLVGCYLVSLKEPIYSFEVAVGVGQGIGGLMVLAYLYTLNWLWRQGWIE